jgi:hypothetical protein
MYERATYLHFDTNAHERVFDTGFFFRNESGNVFENSVKCCDILVR